MKFRLILSVFSLLFTFGLVSGQPVVDTLLARKVLITNMSAINTPRSEFCPVAYFDKLGFTFSKSDDNHEYFYDIGFVDIADTLSKIQALGPLINTNNHEGPFVVDSHDSIVYTTWVRTVEHPRNKSKRSLRQIVSYDLTSEAPAVLLPFNDALHHVCHPTLSSDGNTMVFAADYTDDTGMDLYEVRRIDGVWQEHQPLLTAINTASHEYFPSLYGDNILVFSSDRSGNIDLYVSKREDGEWSPPQKFPAPFNSTSDDIGMYIMDNGKEGYLSSNRVGGLGEDDIYHWQSDQSIFYDVVNYQKEIALTVMEKLGFKPIEGATVQVFPLNLQDQNVILDLIQGTTSDGELLLKLKPKTLDPTTIIKTDASGKTVLDYLDGETHLVVVSADGMSDYSFLMHGDMQDVTALLNPQPQQETPTPVSKSHAVPSSKGEVVVYENIYYDYNSSKIRDGAAVELDALAQAMIEQPTMIIQLSAHTDSRGPEDYNQQLSEQRALAAKLYLIKKGVGKERIYSVGYGESRLRNHCLNGVSCSEEEHRYNRRTEVLVIEE